MTCWPVIAAPSEQRVLEVKGLVGALFAVWLEQTNGHKPSSGAATSSCT
jgi:hypothetical protein